MTFRMPDDPAGLALIRRYVVWAADRTSVHSRIRRYVRAAGPTAYGARYLGLLHANFLQVQDPGHNTFATALAEDARQISDTDLGTLLEFEWRARLTAAWLIGLDQRTQFRQTVGDLLLESELVYAGEGYCFALSRFAQPEDADILIAYLDRYLPRADCHYNQDAAIGALLHLDQKLGTDHAQRFIVPEGLWYQSAFAHRDPLDCQSTTEQLCTFADHLMNN
jgi:hypothetical protein